MTLWSDLFHNRHMLSREEYSQPQSVTLTAPADAAFMVVSACAAGGWKSGGWGHGSSFARVKLPVAPGDEFTLQVGDIAHSLDAGDSLGDTILTRRSDSTVVLKAERGSSTAPGNAANCVGDTTRSGGVWSGAAEGGASAGDDSDFFPLGFGGRGASPNSQSPYQQNPGRAAWFGAGGAKNVQPFPGYGVTFTYPPGSGRAVVEWYDQDPGALS